MDATALILTGSASLPGLEFRRFPLEFRSEYLTHKFKDVYIIKKNTKSYIHELVDLFVEMHPWTGLSNDFNHLCCLSIENWYMTQTYSPVSLYEFSS